MAKPIRGCVIFQFTNVREKDKECSDLDLTKMTFEPEVPGEKVCGGSSCHCFPPKIVPVDYFLKDSGVIGALTTFILDKLNGFT